MKILHYYWSQYYDIGKMGGGVQVYLKNIIGEQSKSNVVYTLAGGTEYDLSGKCTINKIEVQNSLTEDYVIVNSPMLAPSKASFYDLQIYINDNKLDKILEEFIEEKGPFDVIHIHSMEGLTLSCLKLKKVFPNTKFVLSLHNYYAFCPQVNLWYRDKLNCRDYSNGEKCYSCGQGLPFSSVVKKSYTINTYIKRVGMVKLYQNILNYSRKVFKRIYKKKNNYDVQSVITDKYAVNYRNFREKNIEYINKYIDVVICVSARVRDIAIEYGLEKKKCKVLYIGTEFAKKQLESPAYLYKDGCFSIIYMGYMRRDKGFYFLLDCLKEMPNDIAKKLRVVIAAKYDDMNAVLGLEKISHKFANLELHNGYTHNNIKQITQNVNLGIVPVMWEDNLPQVAMELKSMGIPVLSSNRGGASELSKCEAFCFRAGEKESFVSKLDNIINNPSLLEKYYENGMKLNSNEEHCNMLEKEYLS